ncbi:uncharacterized protein LOC123704855 [Colias croceus]|uniref:uncharacterized protein LOC123704855 n=1 Tax=Colias crocea TaxID=72248 RepID=UPI001E27C45F|nr:uncharacterized protein LOC123704855 [Colias croceus]
MKHYFLVLTITYVNTEDWEKMQFCANIKCDDVKDEVCGIREEGDGFRLKLFENECQLLRYGCNVDEKLEDYSKEVLEKRRQLLPQLKEERAKGKICYLVKDKLITKENKEDQKDKRKRYRNESPNKSPNHATMPASKKCPKQRLSKGYLQSRIKHLEDYWKTFQSAHLDLVKITPREQKALLPYFVNEEFYIHEDLYLCILADLKDKLLNMESTASALESSHDSTVVHINERKKCISQTASQLKSLLDTTNEVLNSLENLNVSIDSWDPIIIFLVVQKLDPESHKAWEEFAYTKSEELPKCDSNINDLLKTIWEIDIDTNRKLTKEEQLCEDIYERTHERDSNGKYIVTLPFKTGKLLSPEGNTREVAVRRLLQLERRFKRDPDLKKEYLKVIEEYKELKHIEEVPEKEINKKAVYLPHHAVVRQDKETTKTRVVFDASCKGSNNVSLNDELLPGPVLQEDLRNIIMRWRTHKICFVSDIQKMYRMIWMNRNDVDYQRIVWRNDPTENIQDMRLLTVTFGTASAPYLAVRTLKQLAADEGHHFPEAARILNEDFYVDDCMSGGDDLEQCIQLRKDLTELLRRGGFDLKKWSSNSAEFLQSLEPNDRSTKAHLDIKLDGIVKALGVQWNLGTDRFEYNFSLESIDDDNVIITKRNILSDIQKLFDPLGWIAPCIVLAKILMQKLWLEKANWDEDLNIFIKEEWKNIRNDLQNIKDITIDRWLGTVNTNFDTIEIHGFSDASTLAYAAVVYCRVRNDDGTYSTSLIAARTRVAPLKTISWLRNNELQLERPEYIQTDLEEKKIPINTVTLTNTIQDKISLKFEEFDTLKELLKTIAYCKKFLRFKKNKEDMKITIEYLTSLQQRTRWLKKNDEFKVGDVILIKQPNLPPGKWALGRITAKHPGPDGFTRVYSVKSGDSVIKRSVSKLCYLPINTDIN